MNTSLLLFTVKASLEKVIVKVITHRMVMDSIFILFHLVALFHRLNNMEENYVTCMEAWCRKRPLQAVHRRI